MGAAAGARLALDLDGAVETVEAAAAVERVLATVDAEAAVERVLGRGGGGEP